MSILWTLTGLVLTGIITGAITSSLTTLTVPPDVKLYGTKVSDFLTTLHYSKVTNCVLATIIWNSETGYNGKTCVTQMHFRIKCRNQTAEN